MKELLLTGGRIGHVLKRACISEVLATGGNLMSSCVSKIL